MGQESVVLSDRKRLAHLVKPTDQRRVIIDLVREHGWKRGAEVGVLKGKTLFSVLDACPDLSMIGVDQWKVLPLRPDENAETYADFDMRAIETDVHRKMSRYGGRCQIFKGDSVSQARRLQDGWLDFVFIDADHTEEGVRRDIEAWAPKVRAGGMILGHDLWWSTVGKVVREMFPDHVAYGEEVWGVVKQ
jgi:hypothetical protein